MKTFREFLREIHDSHSRWVKCHNCGEQVHQSEAVVKKINKKKYLVHKDCPKTIKEDNKIPIEETFSKNSLENFKHDDEFLTGNKIENVNSRLRKSGHGARGSGGILATLKRNHKKEGNLA